MTQVQVKFQGAAQRYPVEIVGGETSLKDYLVNKGANLGAQFSINGKQLDNRQLDMSFVDIIGYGLATPGSVVMIYETMKTNGAC